MKAVICSIQFSPASEDDIRATSIIEITSTKIDEPNSVSDPRLGSMRVQSNSGGLKTEKEYCVTCKMGESECAGHFGYISLKYPILHPLFSKYVLKILRMFCYNCGRFMYIRLSGTYPHFENVTFEKTICPRCCSAQPVWTFVDEATRAKFCFKGGREIFMTPAELRIMLMNLDKEDLARIGVTPHPENFVITLLPVLPPCARPPLYIDGQLHDDHLTIQYNEIVKININLPDDPAKATLLDLKKLTYKITNLFVEKAGANAASMGSVTKPVNKRLSGKKGHMRDSIMGKRVDKSGRTVIGPEPTLLIHQVAIPQEMARILTRKETVTDYNIEHFSALLRARTEAIYYVYRRDKSGQERSFNTAYIKGDFKLQVGDEIDRRLRDGDIVNIGRQPTLHMGSLVSQHTVVHSARTICFNLSNTKTFNADFDGDEMNIHVPQSCNAVCELEELSSIKNHLLSQKNGKPNIVLVQDNLLALYLMTHENMELAREEFFDLLMFYVDEHRAAWSFERIDEALEHIAAYDSHAIFGLCFPSNFEYEDETIHIKKRRLVRGVYDKSVMTKIFDVIYHIYPSSICEMVVNNLQLVSNQWLRLRGFSVGLEDCMLAKDDISALINTHVEKSFYEATIVEATVQNKRIREVRVQEVLNRAQAVGLRIAKDGFRVDNNLVRMIKSGSKGDYFNVAQICGLLGQQYIEGARARPDLNNGARTLYHYPFEVSGAEAFTARGFIRSNFFGGLDPRALYFHGEAGRAGVVDTAMGTSTTGYMHRRIIKLTEDLKVTYDGTVRDDMNSILQFKYGNGFEVTKSPEPSKIQDLARVLNNEYELLCQ
jgi:DNA-directed RNA polymerase beta' subunit